jgi:hypothetical protein
MRIILKKNCVQCEKEFVKPIWISLKNWNKTRKYCSTECQSKFWVGRPGRKLGHIGQKAWNKGKKLHYQVWNKGKGDYAKKLGFGKWMLGKKASPEARKSNSERMKRRIAEGKHNFYIDGRTPINKLLRHSLEYKLWRETVFKRDNWTCQECNARNGNGKAVYLHAHHVKPFAYHPELRFELSNGRTLCRSCHAKTDTYKRKAINYKT